MIYVLINASLIWLFSLLVYELLLRKETFHGLNRCYLLLTFCCGLLLPLLPWPRGSVSLQMAPMPAPAVAVAALPGPTPAAQAGLQKLVAPSPASLPRYLLLIYAIGLAVGLLFLLKDILRIMLLFRNGRRSRLGNWTIVETQAVHSPFSLLRILFVSDRGNYTDEQWAMILQHEQQHYSSRHLADLMLFQSASLLLWFHPLVHWYRRRIQLVHEYEVDSLQDSDLQTYGRFLLEQAAFKPAPIPAHAFNFSPLKNRIKMMTRTKSQRTRRYRFLLLLPMLGVFSYCCAQNAAKMQVVTEDNRTHLKEDVLVINYGPTDTIYIENPVTQAREMMLSKKQEPGSLNGQKIRQTDELKYQVQCISQKEPVSLADICKKLQLEPLLLELGDGEHFMGINELIIGPAGRISSYSLLLPQERTLRLDTIPPRQLSEATATLLSSKLAQYLLGDQLRFTKGRTPDGQTVPYLFKSLEMYTRFRISNGQLSFL